MSWKEPEDEIRAAIDDILSVSPWFEKEVDRVRAALFPSLVQDEVSEDVWNEVTCYVYDLCHGNLMKEMFCGD